jgi:hypothetical protein
VSYTKQQFINDAFDEIGLATYNFDLQPEQLQSSLRKLDRMMATWNGKGIQLSYPIPSSPENSMLDEETNVPDSANEAIALNLAIRIAPAFGKQVSRELKASAKEAYQVLLLRAIKPVEQQITDLPRGAGNKPWRYDSSEFLDEANTDPLKIGEGGNLDFT